RRPRVAVTTGDPSGIGPEIVAAAIADPRVIDACDPAAYGPLDPQELKQFPAGRVAAESGHAAYGTIVAAVDDARAGRVDAIATAPVNKAAFAAAGLPWKGHTDLLAHLTGSPRGVMMFHSDTLRVMLATVHIPLAAVPAAITSSLIEDIVSLTAVELPRFGIPSPR